MTFIHIYVNFRTTLNMEGICTNLIILEGVKEVVKSSQLANFQTGSSLIFPGFIPILMKFEPPVYERLRSEPTVFGRVKGIIK